MRARSSLPRYLQQWCCNNNRNFSPPIFSHFTGGPKYSQAGGGYLPTDSFFPVPIPFGLNEPFNYGAVNNAGVAIGNIDRIDKPLSTTPQSVYPSVGVWSATQTPVILNAGSPTTSSQAFAINCSGTIVGVTVNGMSELRSTQSSSGTSDVNTTYSAAQWNAPVAGLTTLGGLGSGAPTTNFVRAINSQGIAVGTLSKLDSNGASQGLHGAVEYRYRRCQPNSVS